MYHTQYKTLFVSPARKIGKGEWRVLVYEKPEDGLYFQGAWHPHALRFTGYQYLDWGKWADETSHPRYDSNDGTYAGLPKGLCHLYEDRKHEIAEALGDLSPDNVRKSLCKHPPTRLYSWHVGETLCVCCNDCGTVLTGAAELE